MSRPSCSGVTPSVMTLRSSSSAHRYEPSASSAMCAPATFQRTSSSFSVDTHGTRASLVAFSAAGKAAVVVSMTILSCNGPRARLLVFCPECWKREFGGSA